MIYTMSVQVVGEQFLILFGPFVDLLLSIIYLTEIIVFSKSLNLSTKIIKILRKLKQQVIRINTIQYKIIPQIMSNKREKLNILRQKINIMQSDLKVLQGKKGKLLSPTGLDKPIHKITNSRPKKMFYQTQKQITFSFRDCDSFFIKEQSKGQGQRSKGKIETERSLSPVLKDIVNRMQTHYYKKNEVPVLDKCQNTSLSETQRLYQTSFIGRRYAYNDFGLSRGETSRQTKLRTFEKKKTDTIVNPESQKELGIKIVNKIEKSPKHMLTQNPRSNPKLFFFAEKPIYFQKKMQFTDKNKSSLIFSASQKQMMLTKTADSLEKRVRSQKKHFQRYNEQLFCSRSKQKI